MRTAEEIVRKRLGAEFVKAVHVRRDVNSDGEPILHIRVVYDEGSGPPATRDMVELTEELLDLASEDAGMGFPVTDFVSAEDDARQAVAA